MTEGIFSYFILGTLSRHADLHAPMAWGIVSKESALLCEELLCQVILTLVETSVESCTTQRVRAKQTISEAEEKNTIPTLRYVCCRHGSLVTALIPPLKHLKYVRVIYKCSSLLFSKQDSVLLSVKSTENFPLTLMVSSQAINSSSSLATCADLFLNFLGFVIILLESKSFCAIFLFTVVSKNPLFIICDFH